MEDSHFFHKKDLIKILDSCVDKTLGEVDKNNVFDKTKEKPKITGIAGDVIEQSVLGYPADNRQEPDLNIDDVETELKTTGLKYKNNGEFVAKEPMSITAVSPDKIVSETFYESNFWHKIAHILFVYYLYDSPTTVKASNYANFPIKGYQFHEFDDEDKEILKNDWTLVRDFIKELQENYEDYENEYPRISYELRPKLMYIDTAPKWPNPPRFRLKRTVVSSIVQEHFGEKFEQLPGKYTTYTSIDKKCNELTKQYSQKTVEELKELFKINGKRINKAIGEKIIIKMFGGHANQMQKIELFKKAGIIGKTITLTKAGLRTEDMKLFKIDFNEIQNEEINFYESQFYEYFTNNHLCIIFEEPSTEAPLKENIFLGFKWVRFDEKFIEKQVKPVWEDIKYKIINNKLKEEPILTKDGLPRTNKSGNVMTSINFPKSSEGNIFVRGSGKDSNSKPLTINEISMYMQYIWIKGKYMATELNTSEFI